MEFWTHMKTWSNVFSEVLFLKSFNKWCASSKWADRVIYCCEMAFVTASFIHFTLTKDWFKIWSWLNYSWILYYPLGSLSSVLPMLVGAFLVFSKFIQYNHVVTFLQWSHISSYNYLLYFLQQRATRYFLHWLSVSFCS